MAVCIPNWPSRQMRAERHRNLYPHTQHRHPVHPSPQLLRRCHCLSSEGGLRLSGSVERARGGGAWCAVRACMEAVPPPLHLPPSQRVHARLGGPRCACPGNAGAKEPLAWPPTLSPLPRIAPPQPSPSALASAASSFAPDSQQVARFAAEMTGHAQRSLISRDILFGAMANGKCIPP